MNDLLKKYMSYKSICNYSVEYVFEDESCIDFMIKQNDFPHLIGLHKLIDIPVIRQFNDRKNRTVSAKYIISKIKKEELLTDEIVRASSYFDRIEARYENFNRDNLLTLSYTDVIIDFNSKLIGSSLRANHILYEQKNHTGYNHLCIAEDDKNNSYTESFFYNPTDLYIRNQKTMKIKTVKIFDSKGDLYLEDKLM